MDSQLTPDTFTPPPVTGAMNTIPLDPAPPATPPVAPPPPVVSPEPAATPQPAPTPSPTPAVQNRATAPTSPLVANILLGLGIALILVGVVVLVVLYLSGRFFAA